MTTSIPSSSVAYSTPLAFPEIADNLAVQVEALKAKLTEKDAVIENLTTYARDLETRLQAAMQRLSDQEKDAAQALRREEEHAYQLQREAAALQTQAATLAARAAIRIVAVPSTTAFSPARTGAAAYLAAIDSQSRRQLPVIPAIGAAKHLASLSQTARSS